MLVKCLAKGAYLCKLGIVENDISMLFTYISIISIYILSNFCVCSIFTSQVNFNFIAVLCICIFYIRNLDSFWYDKTIPRSWVKLGSDHILLPAWHQAFTRTNADPDSNVHGANMGPWTLQSGELLPIGALGTKFRHILWNQNGKVQVTMSSRLIALVTKAFITKNWEEVCQNNPHICTDGK